MQCQGLLNPARLTQRSSLMPSLLPQKMNNLILLAGRPRHLALVVSARKQNNPVTEADLYIGIDPSSAPSPDQNGSSTPWYITVPAAFIAILALFRTIGTLSRKRNRSLEDRGYKPNGGASEDSYSKAMRGMKKVQLEELSDEQV